MDTLRLIYEQEGYHAAVHASGADCHYEQCCLCEECWEAWTRDPRYTADMLGVIIDWEVDNIFPTMQY